jgi:hypothetical protein
MTVARKPGHRGERAISRKTTARGMPGDFRCDLTNACAFYHYRCTRGYRAHRAPGIPCALVFEGKDFQQHSDATRRENAKVYPVNAKALHSLSSSPAKAGDPVLRDVSDRIERPQRLRRGCLKIWIETVRFLSVPSPLVGEGQGGGWSQTPDSRTPLTPTLSRRGRGSSPPMPRY